MTRRGSGDNDKTCTNSGDYFWSQKPQVNGNEDFKSLVMVATRLHSDKNITQSTQNIWVNKH